MAELEFMFRGESLTADELAKRNPHQRRVKATGMGPQKVSSRSEAKMSLGFIAEGFSPERLAKAQADHAKARQDAIDHNRKLSGSDPTRMKIPPEWDANVYMQSHKPTKARSKPYESEAAAEKCAEMLRKAGWLTVGVREELRA